MRKLHLAFMVLAPLLVFGATKAVFAQSTLPQPTVGITAIDSLVGIYPAFSALVTAVGVLLGWIANHLHFSAKHAKLQNSLNLLVADYNKVKNYVIAHEGRFAAYTNFAYDFSPEVKAWIDAHPREIEAIRQSTVIATGKVDQLNQQVGATDTNNTTTVSVTMPPTATTATAVSIAPAPSPNTIGTRGTSFTPAEVDALQACKTISDVINFVGVQDAQNGTDRFLDALDLFNKLHGLVTPQAAP